VTPGEARDRIRAREDLRAFISLTDEEGSGPVVAVKDLVDVRGTVTTAGGTLLEPVPAVEDAPLVRRMREFGCVVIGKANLHEWAFGVTSSNPHYGAVRNPHDVERIPGGSSGGSAAAVAAGMCDWAVGSDTGGSIRIPAALCGVVGFKPTIGTVDTGRVFPLSRSLDTVGPLAPDVRSAARALEMMSELTGLLPPAHRSLHELRVAAPRGWGEDLHPEIAAAWHRVASGLPRIDFPERRRLAEPSMAILNLEAASVHRRWLEQCPESYGQDVRERLERAMRTSRQDYTRGLLEQSRIRVEAEAAMDGWDALLAPATRIPAPRIGEYHDRSDLTAYTRPFNSTGQPVIAIPAPVDGLPVGIQVVGHFGREAELVEVALALEEAWRSL
jgi:aspartyl-tRNA(Asn)/glutamyl-tRNA(Gln) amidotransferase subunit A